MHRLEIDSSWACPRTVASPLILVEAYAAHIIDVGSTAR